MCPYLTAKISTNATGTLRSSLNLQEVRHIADSCLPDEPLGGDIWDCLSASELDKVLKATVPEALSALAFFNFRCGLSSEDDFTTLMDNHLDEFPEGIFVPLHICHHWLLLQVRREGRERVGRVYDSAPSPLVKKKISKILSSTMTSLAFMPASRQLRFSNECGLFLLVFILRLQRGLECTTPPLPPSCSLMHFRSLLASRDIKGFIDMAISRTFPKLVGGGIGAVNCPTTILMPPLET